MAKKCRSGAAGENVESESRKRWLLGEGGSHGRGSRGLKGRGGEVFPSKGKTMGDRRREVSKAQEIEHPREDAYLPELGGGLEDGGGLDEAMASALKVTVRKETGGAPAGDRFSKEAIANE